MKGWQLKPLGALVALAFFLLFIYVGYRIATYGTLPPSAT
jgi:hypothetical protein